MTSSVLKNNYKLSTNFYVEFVGLIINYKNNYNLLKIIT